MILLSEDHGAVRVLTMNRPEARNALSTKLFESLHAATPMSTGDLAARQREVAARNKRQMG